MQAMTLTASGGLKNLTLTTLSDPGKPGYGEVRVAIYATSLNYHDLLVAEGAIPTAPQRVLMADGAGIVEEVGEGVSEFSVGDRVVSCFFPQWTDGLPFSQVADFTRTPGDGADGFAAEYVLRPATHFTHAPAGWSHAEAATITTSGLTAWRALAGDAALRAGQTVLALGTGGVSITALQIAKAMGTRVIITSSSDEKLAQARSLGADETINYNSTPDWGQAVQDLTNGVGADVVIEVGGPGTLAQSVNAVRVGGHIALIGVLTGREGVVPTSLLMAKQAKIQGLIVGNRRQQQDFISALNQTGLRPVIGQRFTGLSSLADAFALQRSGGHFGKITVEW